MNYLFLMLSCIHDDMALYVSLNTTTARRPGGHQVMHSAAMGVLPASSRAKVVVAVYHAKIDAN